jgi:hypothetical protein
MKTTLLVLQYLPYFESNIMNIRNNFPFGHKFKFETEVELKFLEAKLLLNLGQIY